MRELRALAIIVDIRVRRAEQAYAPAIMNMYQRQQTHPVVQSTSSTGGGPSRTTTQEDSIPHVAFINKLDTQREKAKSYKQSRTAGGSTHGSALQLRSTYLPT